MKLSNKTKRILIAIGVAILIYFLYVKLSGCNNGADINQSGLTLETGDVSDLSTTAGKTSEEPTLEPTEKDTKWSVAEPSMNTDDPTERTTAIRPTETSSDVYDEPSEDYGITVEKKGQYTDKDHVALYLHLYGRLPFNFITKKEAENLGWDGAGNTLWDVAKGKSIGGSRFGNYEGLLPEKKGRQYYECDIDYNGKKRGVKRIVYSNDGLIYYTEDHYETFELLYGEED